MRRQFWQNLIVGLFTLGVIAYGAYFVYQTSEESTILLNSSTLHTTMNNANGIKFYSPVRIHGIKIGKVESVKFSEDPGEDLIYVEMSVRTAYLPLIAISNPDPQAPVRDERGIFGYMYLSSEGLLGDNLLEIYAGKPELAAEAAKKAVWDQAANETKLLWTDAGRDWDPVEAKPEIQDLYYHLIARVSNLDTGHIQDGDIIRTKSGGTGLAGITESLDPTLLRVNKLLDAARTEPGLIHALIYDPKGAELIDKLNGTVGEVKELIADIRKGPGGLHEVIYGNQLQAILNDLTGVSASLKKAIADVQGVTSNVNVIIDDVKKKDLVSNLKGTLANVEGVTAKINNGEGTLGALVTDKSLYQDLQELLGGAKRSVAIREAIRYVRAKNVKDQQDLKALEPQTAPAPKPAPGPAPPPAPASGNTPK